MMLQPMGRNCKYYKPTRMKPPTFDELASQVDCIALILGRQFLPGCSFMAVADRQVEWVELRFLVSQHPAYFSLTYFNNLMASIPNFVSLKQCCQETVDTLLRRANFIAASSKLFCSR